MKNPAFNDQMASWAAAMPDAVLRALLSKYEPEMDVEVRSDWLSMWFYVYLREQGTAPVWAAMSATGHGARMHGSDGAFYEHAKRRMENWSDWQKKAYFKAAKQAGISTDGKVHVGLGPPDDPGSWVTGMDDIHAVARERNLTITRNSDGKVTHQGREVSARHVPLAPDLIEEMVSLERSQDPDLDRRCSKDETALSRLRGLVVEKYGSPAAKVKPSRDRT